MRKTGLSLVVVLGFLAVATGRADAAAEQAAAAVPDKAVVPVAAKEKHSFLDPLGEFARDSILQPKTPFELVPGKDPNGWEFVIEPYVWAMGLNGKTGVNGLPPLDVNFNSVQILQHLDWALMGRGEIRKGRWGVLADGYYAALSGSGEVEGILYKSGTLQLQQGLASLSLAYRIIDDRRGFLDLYAGARYNYMGMQMALTTDSGGISVLSNDMTDRLQTGINRKISDLLASNPGLSQTDLENLVKQALTAHALEKIAGTPKDVREIVKARELGGIFNSRNGAFAEYIAAQAALRLAEQKGQATSAMQGRVDSAKQRLARQLARSIGNALPTYATSDQWWIDPIIGLRGQINFTRWLFLAVQGDVGGFGAGSQITWNTQAAVGVNFTRNIFAELGYRYMYVDYNKNNFLYQMNTFGLFSSVGVKF